MTFYFNEYFIRVGLLELWHNCGQYQATSYLYKDVIKSYLSGSKTLFSSTDCI